MTDLNLVALHSSLSMVGKATSKKGKLENIRIHYRLLHINTVHTVLASTPKYIVILLMLKIVW